MKPIGIPIRFLEEFLRELPRKINTLSINKPFENAVYEDDRGRWDEIPEHTFSTKSEHEYTIAMKMLYESKIWPDALQTLEHEIEHAMTAKSLGYEVLYILMLSRDHDSAQTGIFYICGAIKTDFESSKKSPRQKLLDELAITLAPKKPGKNDLIKAQSIKRELEVCAQHSLNTNSCQHKNS